MEVVREDVFILPCAGGVFCLYKCVFYKKVLLVLHGLWLAL